MITIRLGAIMKSVPALALLAIGAIACGGSGITDAAPSNPSTPAGIVGATATGTWALAAPTAGLSTLRLSLNRESDNSVTGTWTLSRISCGCDEVGTVIQARSFAGPGSLHVEFIIGRFGYGSFTGTFDDANHIRGYISLAYDFEPDSEVRDGPVLLSRAQ